MTVEEIAYNYASTQKPTKLQVGEITKHYNNGYNQALQDFMEKAEEFFYEQFNIHPHDCHVVQYVSDTPLEDIDDFIEQFKNYMQDE